MATSFPNREAALALALKLIIGRNHRTKEKGFADFARQMFNLQVPATFSANQDAPVGTDAQRGLGEFWIRQDNGKVWVYQSTGFVQLGKKLVVDGGGPAASTATPPSVSGDVESVAFDDTLVVAIANGEATVGVRATGLTASGTITKGYGLYINGSGTVAVGDCTDPNKVRVVGVAEVATTNGNLVAFAQRGVVKGALSGATAGVPYYLGSTGAPVLEASVLSGSRLVQLGVAINATDLLVQVVDKGTVP